MDTDIDVSFKCLFVNLRTGQERMAECALRFTKQRARLPAHPREKEHGVGCEALLGGAEMLLLVCPCCVRWGRVS